jgi:hypothetical protein
MQNWVLSAALSVSMILANPVWAVDIASCDSDGRTDLLASSAFIDSNLTKIVDLYTFLDNQQQSEVLKKWPNIKIRCKERGECRTFGALGVAHGGLGDTINICYLQAADAGEHLCDIIGVIMHEFGHANGFPKDKFHDEPYSHPNVFKTDIIYRMGNTASDYCETAARAGTFDNRKLSAPERLALGKPCGRDTDCRSSTCDHGVCACNDDRDCDPMGNKICMKRGLNKNLCGGVNLGTGVACEKDRQCSSGNCKGDKCT